MKTTKLTDEEVNKRFAQAGLKLLEPYQNRYTSLKVECLTCGHQRSVQPQSIFHGNKCPSCSNQLGVTNEEVKRRAAKVGIELLEPYTHWQTKLKVRCLTCSHEWLTLLSNLTLGHGCPACVREAQKISPEELAKRVRAVGAELLDPNPVSHDAFEVRCTTCGHEWIANRRNITSGHGCAACAGNIQLTPEQVEQRAAQAGVKFLEPYQGSWVKTKTECLACGYIWRVKPVYLGQGRGCPECGKKRVGDKLRLTPQKIAEKAKKAAVALLEPYQNGERKTKVKCLVCGHIWRVRLSGINRYGCPVCARGVTPKEVIKRVEQAGMRLLSTYQTARRKIKIQSLACGHIWETRLGDVGRYGCPHCASKRAEREARQIIERLTGWKFPKCKPTWLRDRKGWPLELDGYNEEHKIAFEYQGEQHYQLVPFFGIRTAEDLAELQRRDNKKRCLCQYYGITLIRIPYWKQNVEAFVRVKLRKAGVEIQQKTDCASSQVAL